MNKIENPFLKMTNPNAWGPGSFEMAKSVVDHLKIQPGMRVLEIGGGSGGTVGNFK